MSITDRIKAAFSAFRSSTSSSDAAANHAITEVGPGEPIQPTAPSEPIRLNDYLMGRNMLFTPRSAEPRPVSYSQLRAMADGLPVLRSVIEARKEVIKGLDWSIGVKEQYKHLDFTAEVKEVGRLFERPDGYSTFDQWLGMLVEDVLVCDNMTLYPRLNNAGKVVSIDPVDGDTITVLIDERGRVPEPPEPAYMQIIKSTPRTWYARDRLVYRPYNARTDGVYGYSHVEDILLTINIALRREVQFLEHFRSGNIPYGLIQAPKEWTANQIIEAQNAMDTLLSGDMAQRSKIQIVPGESAVQFMQQLTFDGLFDEWLTRVICARFGVSPTPYVRMMNRATAETVEEESVSRSIVPFMQHFKAVFDDIIAFHCGRPELEFVWTTQQLHYRMEDASINSLMLHDGAVTLDHVRKMRGLPPLPGGLGSEPMVWTGAGPVLLKDIISGKYAGGAPGGTNPLGLPQNAALQLPGPSQDFGLSIEPQEEPAEDFELSLKSELDAWEAFALKRLGKANSRPFACKALNGNIAHEIQSALKGATDPKAVKAVFEVARRNIGRRRTPSAEGSLGKLMSDYEDLIRRAVEKAGEAVTPAVKADFVEAEHPRAGDGKFTSGSGSSGASSSDTPKAPANKPEKPASNNVSNKPAKRLTLGTTQSSENSPNKPQNGIIGAGRQSKLKPAPEGTTHTPSGVLIPKGWKNALITSDPADDLQAVGFDEAGRKQYLYSTDHTTRQKEQKYGRQDRFQAAMPSIQAKLNQDKASKEEAAVLSLISRTGFRVGSENNTRAKVQAYGASTLQGRHIKIDGNVVSFDFIGKKGVHIQQTVEDAELAELLRPRITDPDEPIFNTTDAKIRGYLKSISDKEFKVKDFRTWKANEVARTTIAEMPEPKTEKEKRKAVLAVGLAVSKVLGNTREESLKSYIDPRVFELWEEGQDNG